MSQNFDLSLRYFFMIHLTFFKIFFDIFFTFYIIQINKCLNQNSETRFPAYECILNVVNILCVKSE